VVVHVVDKADLVADEKLGAPWSAARSFRGAQDRSADARERRRHGTRHSARLIRPPREELELTDNPTTSSSSARRGRNVCAEQLRKLDAAAEIVNR